MEEFHIPLISQDLPAPETHRQICMALADLQGCANQVFERLDSAVVWQRERLASIHARLDKVHSQIGGLAELRQVGSRSARQQC